MSKATKRTKQRTFDVDGHKITVKVSTRSYIGNFIGYSAKIHDNRESEMTIPMLHVLFPDEAIEMAYVKFIKQHTPKDPRA